MYKEILERLFAVNGRTLVNWSANHRVLGIIGEYMPLKIHRFPSGTKCFDWTVPHGWENRGAHICEIHEGTDKVFREVFKADRTIDTVVYGRGFCGRIRREDLLEHIHCDKDRPDATPYRTVYYSDREWGFCLPYNLVKTLTRDWYHVDICNEKFDGEMLVGECRLPGRTDREVILSAYYCHPQQANDGLSGIISLIYLHELLCQKRRKYTYRFLFGPETIGALAMLAAGEIVPASVEYAMISTCTGLGSQFNYKATFLGDYPLDRIFQGMHDVDVMPFQPWGGDERQFSSPKVRIPTGSLMRTPYGEYPEHHTDQDNPGLVNTALMVEAAERQYRVLMQYEKRQCYMVAHDGGEPFLSRHGLYRSLSVPGHNHDEKLRNWIIFLSDGEHTSENMAGISGYLVDEIEAHIQTLLNKAVIKET